MQGESRTLCCENRDSLPGACRQALSAYCKSDKKHAQIPTGKILVIENKFCL